MKKYLLLLFPVCFMCVCMLSCKKKTDEPVQNALFKKWYLHKIERSYTDKQGNPSKLFNSWSDVVDDREMFLEFTSQGQLFTYEGNGSFTINGDVINYNLPASQGTYRYTLKDSMLILVTREEADTYNHTATYTMKVF